MLTPQLRLTHPSLPDLDFAPAEGWAPQNFDPGAALTRDVIQARPGSMGVSDSTVLTGERVCTLTVVAVPADPLELAGMDDLLRAYTSPAIRPTMRWTRPGVSERVATVRGLPVVAPVEHLLAQEIVAQWVIPSGRWESAELHQAVIYPGTPDGGLVIPQAGLVIPQAGLVIPSVGPPGFGIVVNAGIVDAPAVLRLFGPFGDTSADETVIANQTTGGQIVLADLQVAAGDYLEIDLDSKRITLNGLAAQSRRSYLDNSQSSWFQLAPGPDGNRIAFLPDTSSGAAQMHVFWRDAY